MTAHGRPRIRFLVKPSLSGSGGWLALREDLLPAGATDDEARRGLARRFRAIEAWFSDLDDFDTRSPAKIIAERAVGAGRLNPAYLWWILETLALFVRVGRKRGEGIAWKKYFDAFLKKDVDHDWLKDEAFRFIDELLTPEGVSRLLYPSVSRFYASFGAEKYLVTRNLERIAYRYSRVIPYSGYYHEVRDKAAVVDSFIAARPGLRRYGSGGDSSEDEGVAELLDFRFRRGDIEQPVCLYRADSPSDLNPAFNVFVGKDRSALVDAIGEVQPSAGAPSGVS